MKDTPSGLPPGRLEERFSVQKPLYTQAEAMAEANRCIYCHDAPCIQACPTHIDVPSFIRKIATENLTGAARTILASNLLGYSCAKVCPVEVLCVGACVYNHEDVPPIAIGRLQHFALASLPPPERLLARAEPTGKKVALVGGGPASLSCGGYLSLNGVSAIVFEKRSFAGGLNTTGIAPYKMTSADAQREVTFIKSLGVRIETGVEVGVSEATRLMAEYDAVFLGVGLGGDKRMGIPGEDGPGVVGATLWIERMKTEPGLKLDGLKDAVVIGGGNTAIDAARELSRLGVPSVTLVYRRSEAEMPSFAHEREQARRERVRFLFNRAPIAVQREGDRVKAITIAWASGGRPLRGSEEDLPAELVVVAIGQRKLADFARAFPGVEVDSKDRFVADPATGRTGNPKVYVGGDAFNGGKEVVNAVEEGKVAAQAILRSFGLPIALETPPKTAIPTSSHP